VFKGPVSGVVTSGRGEDIRNEGRKVNMVEIFCIDMCKWKNGPVETISGMGGRDKGE
jgi:hypothetical protein